MFCVRHDALAALLGDVETEGDDLGKLLDDLAAVADAKGDPGADVGKPDSRAALGRKYVRLVIAGVDLPLIERALAATGSANRAEALTAVCRGYLAEVDGAPESDADADGDELEL